MHSYIAHNEIAGWVNRLQYYYSFTVLVGSKADMLNKTMTFQLKSTVYNEHVEVVRSLHRTHNKPLIVLVSFSQLCSVIKLID